MATKIMIEEQVEGDKNGADYRLLVIDGCLKVCTKGSLLL